MRQMFTVEEIIKATDGKLINKTGNSINTSSVYISGVSNDTRTITEGNLYVAIKGERFDGHDYIDKAVLSGAPISLISDENKLPDNAVGILVTDTVVALGAIARHYRFKLGAKVVAVTGSVGKTSTREIVTCALKAGKKVHTTKANLNNEIGLPNTILSAPEDTEVLVLEMGMRLRGEISYLTKIACPDIAIITNVGYCHIERLGSKEEILLAKNEISEGIVDGGILAINADDSYLFEYCAKNSTIKYMLAGMSLSKDFASRNINCPATVCADNIVSDENGTTFDIIAKRLDETKNIKGVKLKVNGMHNVKNALFALFCSIVLKVDINEAVKALENYETMGGRGASVKTQKYLVINDAYNASPESMEAAFLNTSIIARDRRKVIALGGILELGDYAPMLHEQVGKNCAKYDFDHIFVTGDQSEDFIRGAQEVNPEIKITKCEDTNDVREKLKAYVKPGDALLFKASHAFEFEKLAEEFIEEGNS